LHRRGSFNDFRRADADFGDGSTGCIDASLTCDDDTGVFAEAADALSKIFHVCHEVENFDVFHKMRAQLYRTRS
jgi:hypothetical protein